MLDILKILSECISGLIAIKKKTALMLLFIQIECDVQK